MRQTSLRHVSALAALIVIGCSSPADSGGDDAGAEHDGSHHAPDAGEPDAAEPDAGGGGDTGQADQAASFDEAADEVRVAYCEWRERCGGWDWEYTWGTQDACLEVQRTSPWTGLDGISVTRTELQACADSLAEIDCAEGTPVECDFRGELADGEGCLDSRQCQSGLCVRTYADTCGVCEAPSAVGDPCHSLSIGTEYCSEGLVCVDSICVEGGEDGDACDDDTPCGPGLQCLDGACEEFRALGEPCEISGSPPLASCASGLACDAVAEACVEAPLADLGESCGNVAGAPAIVACRGLATCAPDGAGGHTCQEMRAVGDSCEVFIDVACELGAVCVDGTCEPLTCG